VTPAIITSIRCKSQLASAMASGMEILMCDMREGYGMVQRGRWSGRQQSNDPNQSGAVSYKDCVGPDSLED